jgi:hypothetical protein
VGDPLGWIGGVTLYAELVLIGVIGTRIAHDRWKLSAASLLFALVPVLLLVGWWFLAPNSRWWEAVFIPVACYAAACIWLFRIPVGRRTVTLLTMTVLVIFAVYGFARVWM